VITADHIHADLGEIGTRRMPGRTSEDQITLFKPNGLAIQDVATALLVYHKAKEAGLGV
jgi:alanine dehydrogenase